MGKPGSDGKQGWALGGLRNKQSLRKEDAVGVSALPSELVPPCPNLKNS